MSQGIAFRNGRTKVRPFRCSGPRATLSALLLTTALSQAQRAHADEAPAWDPGQRTTTRLRGEVSPRDDRRLADGVYERFDGDVTFTLGLGVDLGSGTRAAALGRALYYHTAGLTLAYADTLGGDGTLARVLTFGGEVRPLFLPRWVFDMQFGVPTLDLALDSLSLGVGAYFGERRAGSFADTTGLETTLGLGVPLLGSAQGPWIEARGTYRSGLPDGGLGLVLLLSLYETWISPVVK